MSVSCVGTCTACGRRTFWLSDTLCLQLDDGSLKCLPHPAEAGVCEQQGLTLAQASQRGRLFHEEFFVCRHCGRGGSVIEPRHVEERPFKGMTFAQAKKLSMVGLFLVVPIFLSLKWWNPAAVVGITCLVYPFLALHEERKAAAVLAAKGLPSPTAPGAHPVPPPTRSIDDEAVVGQAIGPSGRDLIAIGDCCGAPDWMPAYRVGDDDQIPCCACGHGVMKTSEHSIH